MLTVRANVKPNTNLWYEREIVYPVFSYHGEGAVEREMGRRVRPPERYAWGSEWGEPSVGEPMPQYGGQLHWSTGVKFTFNSS